MPGCSDKRFTRQFFVVLTHMDVHTYIQYVKYVMDGEVATARERPIRAFCCRRFVLEVVSWLERRFRLETKMHAKKVQ